MKRTLLLVALSVGCMCLQAQTKDGGISADMMRQIRQGYQGTAAQKAAKNALAHTAIATLAMSADNLNAVDDHFTYRVPTTGITNQRSSGRCWLFSGLNVLRSRMIQKYDLGRFEFSQNYLSFHDLLEKSNLFLQGIIDTRTKPVDDRMVDWLFANPIGDGGQFTGVSNLVTKYGVVPKEVMPETYQSENTTGMMTVLKMKLREFGLELRGMKDVKQTQARKTAMLTEIYRILVECLGVPPTEFDYTLYNKKGDVVSSKSYTPQSFYQEYLGLDLENGYVMLMNDPSREYNKVYEIDYDRHVYDGQNWLYVNLPIERIKEMAIASIKDNTALYFSCDVGKFLDRAKGTCDLKNIDYASLFDTKFPMDKKERIQTHASGSSHAMTLIAVDLGKQGVPVKWMVENSWGETGWKGNIIMTDEWFNEYMFRLVVEKKYVPADVLDMLKQKPTLLPAWDPMFMPEE